MMAEVLGEIGLDRPPLPERGPPDSTMTVSCATNGLRRESHTLPTPDSLFTTRHAVGSMTSSDGPAMDRIPFGCPHTSSGSARNGHFLGPGA